MIRALRDGAERAEHNKNREGDRCCWRAWRMHGPVCRRVCGAILPISARVDGREEQGSDDYVVSAGLETVSSPKMEIVNDCFGDTGLLCHRPNEIRRKRCPRAIDSDLSEFAVSGTNPLLMRCPFLGRGVKPIFLSMILN
jgi:hypothetical protein